jgi:hypothetical protein
MEQPKAEEKAIKYDQGKVRWDLMPWQELGDVAKVFTYGSLKYGDRNWEKGIKPDRLFAAAMRHIAAVANDEQLDVESNLPHLAHATANLLMWLNVQKQMGEFKE